MDWIMRHWNGRLAELDTVVLAARWQQAKVATSRASNFQAGKVHRKKREAQWHSMMGTIMHVDGESHVVHTWIFF